MMMFASCRYWLVAPQTYQEAAPAAWRPGAGRRWTSRLNCVWSAELRRAFTSVGVTQTFDAAHRQAAGGRLRGVLGSQAPDGHDFRA